MPILELQLLGAILGICGFIALNFILGLYLSVRSLEGHIERKDMLTIIAAAIILLVSGLLCYSIGSSQTLSFYSASNIILIN